MTSDVTARAKAADTITPGKDICLLALDGGGVRGLSALHILKQLMELVDPENPPKPCDYFDLIGGTSTGGLIAIMLGRLHMNVDECITEYKKLSTRVFTKIHHRINWKGDVQGRFDHEALVLGVQELLVSRGLDKDVLLKDAAGASGCKTFVCATSELTGDTVILSSYFSRRRGTSLLNVAKVWEASRATSAASSFFDSIQIDSEGFVDGASGANNPIDEIWSEARDIWRESSDWRLEDNLRCLVSIGTGVPTLKPFGKDAIKIGKSLVSIALDTERRHNTFQKHHSSLFRENRGFRFNVIRGLEDIGLEEADKQGDILAATRRYTQSEDIYDRMEACAQALHDRKWFWQTVQEVYSKDKQYDLSYSFSDDSPLREQYFMPYCNTSSFRAWCENKATGLRCEPPPNAPWPTRSLAAFILDQLRAIKPRSFLNTTEDVNVLVARWDSSADGSLKDLHQVWLSLLGQTLKLILDRYLNGNTLEHELEHTARNLLPIAACQQFYVARKYGQQRVQSGQLLATLKSILLDNDEPVVMVLLGSVKTEHWMNVIGSLAANSTTRHIKILLCGEVSDLGSPNFRHFESIDAKTEYKECIQSLCLDGYRDRRDEVAIREPETNQWIWNHPSFQAWASSKTGVLCILGKPGSGKSVLAKTIQENEVAKSTVSSYWFYSKRKGEKYTSHASLIQTVLCQILESNSKYLPYYYDSYRRRYPERSILTIEDMICVLKKIAEAGESIFCLIDALDEADDDTILHTIGDLVFHTPNSRMKFIILSRPLPCLEQKHWLDYSVVLQRENEPDVQRIIDAGLKRLQEAMHSLDSDEDTDGEDDDSPSIRRGPLRTKSSPMHKTSQRRIKARHPEQTDMTTIREALLLRSDGVILWVALCIEELLKLVRSPLFRTHQLKVKINSLPADMTDFYSQIVHDLQNALSEDDLAVSRQALMWVAGASELGTFHLQELWDALAVSAPPTGPIPEGDDPIVFNRIQVRTWNQFRRTLQKLCGPFIEVLPSESDGHSQSAPRKEHAGPESIVQLMHQTSKDFLGNRDDAGPLHFTREAARAFVIDGIIRYLITSHTYVPEIQSSPSPDWIFQWVKSVDNLTAYLDDRKMLHFALAVSKSEQLVVDVTTAIARACLLPKMQIHDANVQLHDKAFDEIPQKLMGFIGAESALVGRLFYNAVTYGLSNAVVNLLDMSMLIETWWPQFEDSVLNAAYLAALDHNMNELGDLLWTDARKEKYNVFSLPPKIRAQASSLGEISGDEDDVEVAISRIISRWQLLERRGTIGTLGVCALDSKARSKPISRLLEQISQNAEFDIIMFGDKNILDEPVENWPPCDFLISFFSGGFPLQKAIDYVTLRKPHCVNDLHMQMALRDRRVTLAFLDEIGVPTIERVEVNRDGDFAMPYAVLIRRVNSGSGLVTLEEDGDVLVVGVKRLRKPFVEKPVDSDDHNIYIYFSNDQGGGGRRLFRKTNNKSSEVDETLHVPRAITEPESSYIYEKFLEAENAEDVKAYTAGEFYCRAETRKAPIVDGVVKRNTHGKEIRYITSLSRDETRMASKIVQGFGQTVCGFGIIRSNGQSYVHSVSGWSLVKDNAEYSKNCAAVLRQLFIDETRNRELPRGLAKTFISRNVQSRSVQASFNKKLEWDLPELSTAPKGHEYNDLYPIQLRRHESRTLPGISKHFAPSSLRSPVTGSGGSKPSSLPSSRDIKYGHNSGLSSSGTSDKKSPMAWKLKGIVAVHSHGDSTPKQDLEFTFHTDPFIDLLEGHGNEVTLTKQSAITRLQSVADSALHVAAENADDLRKLNTALQKTVKEVKLSTKPTDFGSPPVPEQVNLVIHLGNDPTHALIYQTRELAENFRREFLLMNAELLGDLHVFCSSEAAASYTAHIFTARLLGFNDIPSDFIQERNDLLGDSLDATGQLETAQKQLNQLLREEMKPSAQSVWPLDMPEPSVVGKRLHQSIIANRTTVLLNFSKLNSANINLVQSRWCSGQDPYLFMDRWEKLLARICGAPRIDPAQIVELYNSLKFDAVHNREFLEWCFTPTDPTSSDSREDTMANYSTLHSRIPAPAQHQDNSLKRLHELWHLCKTMFDYIYPLKYGTTSGDKLEIGLLYSLPLLQEVVQDLEEMQASDDSKSFFYFTNNSHMYTLLNCILEGTLKSKMATNQIPTLDCLSSMCFELYERHSSNSREFEYSLKITLSPGCHAYDPLNTVVDSHHAIFSAPRRDLTGHIDWKEAIETLRVSIQRMKLPKSFMT